MKGKKMCFPKQTKPQGYKTFFMLNSTEHEIHSAHINVKMPTSVGILTFISRINTSYESLKATIPIFFSVLVFMSS